jgi:hypothetical protein
MSWFKDLLRNPPTKAGPELAKHAASGAVPALPVDPDAARAAMAAATDDEQRRRCADELGRVLAGLQRMPLTDDEPSVWATAVSQVADKALALKWLGSLNGDSCLGEVAARGRFAEVRLAAVQRIADPEVLESVARLSRGKDKGVFRHCYNVLWQRRHGAERARRAAQLAEAMRDLLAHSPLSITSLLDLQRELQGLEEGAESLPECRTLLEQANERLRQESDARRNLQARRDEAAELAVHCADHSWPEPEQLDRWRDSFSILTQAHAGLPEWLADKAASHELAASLRQIQSRLTALETEEARIQGCEQFLSALESGSVQVDTAASWEAIPKPDRPEMRERFRARWQALQAQVPPPEVTPAPRPEPRAQPAKRSKAWSAGLPCVGQWHRDCSERRPAWAS